VRTVIKVFLEKYAWQKYAWVGVTAFALGLAVAIITELPVAALLVATGIVAFCAYLDTK